MWDVGSTSDGGPCGSGWLHLRLSALLILLSHAPALAQDPTLAPEVADNATVAQLHSDLGRARQEIAALRATGTEMQRSLDARDAALADLRERIDAVFAAADERAERLTIERDRAIARTAELERRLGESAVAATLAPTSPENAAVELAVLKGQPPPTPVRKPPATPDATDGTSPAPAGAAALAQVMTGGLADLRGVEAAGDGRLVVAGAALFAPGQAQLSGAGRQQLGAVAERLTLALAKLPADAAWVLHVDGHTDDTPVRRSGFASNEELSLARARAVTELLTQKGLPAERLVANGLADTRPLVTGQTEAARSRNRRIEFWLGTP